MSFQVQYEALSKDARQWYATGEVLAQAARTAAALDLSGEWSFAGRQAGLSTTYDELVGRASQLLLQGASRCDAIGDRLREVRDVYEHGDAAEKARFQSLWAPK